MIKKFLQRFYLVLIFVLLYAPIVTLMVLSFNKSKTRSKWGGFTTKWYVELFKNEQIMNALYTTLIIALLSALIATVIGTVAVKCDYISQWGGKLIVDGDFAASGFVQH